MTFNGDLKDINLGDVFQNIHSNRLTGTLQLTLAGGRRFVYFSEGCVAGFSVGVNRGLPLGDHLVQRQYVSAEELARALKRKTKQRTTLRAALVAMRCMEEDQFRGAVTELVQEHLYDLLAVREAEFVFTDGDALPRVFDGEQKALRFSIDPSSILMEGARRVDEYSRIQQVVNSDRDIFVMVEGSEDVELGEIDAQVAAWLDGQHDIKAIAAALPYARFDVLKSIHDLVKQDLARPLSGRELEEMAEKAISSGCVEEAVSLLGRALLTERSNTDLRARLAELLEKSGQREQAGAELAILGYQAAERGAIDEALDFYSRAAELHPSDLALKERCVDLLRDHDPDEYGRALCDYAERLLAAGLAEKARGLLEIAITKAKGERVRPLAEKLAEIEGALGHYAAASAIYQRLAKNLPRAEEEARLHLLRKAYALLPDDEVLADTVRDLETGRSKRRRRRLRMLVGLASAATLLLATSTMGIIEMIASHRVIGGISDELDAMVTGRPAAALDALQQIEDQLGFTLAGQRAARLRQRLLDHQIRHLEGELAAGHTRVAEQGLAQLKVQVRRADEKLRLDALIKRARIEQNAQELFAAINTARPDEVSLRAFEGLSDPGLLDFMLVRLERDAVDPRARIAVLKVLHRMDNPRCLPGVARAYLSSEDRELQSIAGRILGGAAAHRSAGRQSDWQDVYPLIQKALTDPVRAERARDVERWLRGER